MKNYFSFVLWGLTAFFAATFLVMFILFIPTQDEEGAQEETPPTEQAPDEKQSGNEENESDQPSQEEESSGDNQDSNSEEGENNNGEEEASNDEESSQKIYWGIDSASYTNEDLYSCTVDNFGEPDVWGRYLGNREGISKGLDSQEVSFLHDNGIPILVIYNHVNNATGSEQGVNHAEQAISMAEDLEVPEGVALFLDIEPEYPVDSAFLGAWYDTLESSKYYPAIYGVFDEDSHLLEAYNAMNQEIQENTIVWTAYPQEEITTKDNAPEFNPQGPENSMLYGWQYAIDAQTCNIDTNLFKGEIMDYLWQE